MNDTQTIEILKSLRLHAMASVYEASLRFAPGAAPSTDALFYQVTDPAGDVLTDTRGLSGSFPFSNGYQTLNRAFLVRLEPGQFPPPGTYSDIFNLLLYQGTSAAGTLHDQASIAVTVTMPEVIDMQITASGGARQHGVRGRDRVDQQRGAGAGRRRGIDRL